METSVILTTTTQLTGSMQVESQNDKTITASEVAELTEEEPENCANTTERGINELIQKEIDNNMNDAPSELNESTKEEVKNGKNNPPKELNESEPEALHEGQNNTLNEITEPVLKGTENTTQINSAVSEVNEMVQTDLQNTKNTTPSEICESGEKQSDVDKTDLPSGSKTDSVILSSSSNESAVATASRSQQSKPLISERIAFEVPIITEDVPEFAQPNQIKSIYTEATGPTFYNISSNLATLPIISKNLPDHFASLPVFGAPKKREQLPEFYHFKIRDFVGDDLTNEEFEKLAEYCSPNHLRTGAELSMPARAPTYGLLPGDSEEKLLLEKSSMFNNTTNLCIHKRYQLRVDRDIGNHYSKRLKYRGIRLMSLAPEDSKAAPPETEMAEEPELVPGKDMLFRIRIYRPYDYNIKYFRGRSRHAVFCCDVVAAGRQPLSTLRDRIVCANDVGMRLDVSDSPDAGSESSAKEVFPSGFLFINNVFYVDSRPGCVDHAAGLRAWARRRGVGDFPSRDLNVPIQDVPIRMGYPDVYVHQGNCEHLFTFSEIRLVGPTDPLRLSQYPGHTATSSAQTVYCTTCSEFCAKWIVVGCARVPFDPAFFCDTCFKLYLYKDGKKIGDFKAYCYRGNELNLLKPQD